MISRLLLFFSLFFSISMFAQQTTASIEGRLVEPDGNTPIPFALVAVVQQETGFQYSGTTDNEGRFRVLNLKPGGPYQIEITSISFSNYTENNVYLKLGESYQLNVKLEPSSENLEEVIVQGKSGRRKQAINGDNISKTSTLDRSLQEVTRLNPYSNNAAIGGNNYRFNSLSVDGAALNDALGFQEPASGASGSVASGTPGALSKTQPISLEVLDAVEIDIAPFDVKIGNFTGGSVNAVTRSGTNKLKGSAYIFGRSQALTGSKLNGEDYERQEFSDVQGGFTISGPIIKNKWFYLFNIERGVRTEPVPFKAGEDGSQIPFSVVQAVSDTLQARYNYNPGATGDISKEISNTKLFFRTDYQINQNNTIAIRTNYVDASAYNLERGANFFKYGSQGFTHNSKTSSTVLELKSNLRNKASNSLTVGYTHTRDQRDWEGDLFPHVEVRYGSANNILFGPYREASVYGLDLGTLQINDHFNYYLGKHTLSIGTHNELYNIQYRFLTAWNGRWEYASLDDFYNNSPRRVRGVYAFGENDLQTVSEQPSADFRVGLVSGYIQDKYAVNNRLTLQAGLRVDMQMMPTEVNRIEELKQNPEFDQYANNFGYEPILNPRVSFQYEVSPNIRLSGGSGTFTGRIPFAWYAYTHYISGNDYGNIDLRNQTDLEITTDLKELSNLQPGLTEINTVENGFQLPRSWKSQIRLDYQMNDRVSLYAEGIYSKVLKGVVFSAINQVEEFGELSDGRPYYTTDEKIEENFTQHYVLKNTDQGFQYSVSAGLNAELPSNVFVTASYVYGLSKDIANGVRNSMAANWSVNMARNPMNPELAYSNFDLRHRLVMTANKTLNWKNGMSTNIQIFGQIASGSPFSFIVNGDVNRDGSNKNDVFYVPESSEDIEFKEYTDASGNIVSEADQYAALDEYINRYDYLSERRGQFTERNGGRTPWNSRFDLAIRHAIPVGKKGKSVELSLDMFNFANLLNSEWGLQKFVPNISNSSYALISLEEFKGNTPVYEFKLPEEDPWQIDPISSRWQAQLGLRFRF